MTHRLLKKISFLWYSSKDLLKLRHKLRHTRIWMNCNLSHFVAFAWTRKSANWLWYRQWMVNGDVFSKTWVVEFFMFPYEVIQIRTGAWLRDTMSCHPRNMDNSFYYGGQMTAGELDNDWSILVFIQSCQRMWGITEWTVTIELPDALARCICTVRCFKRNVNLITTCSRPFQWMHYSQCIVDINKRDSR